MTIKEFKKWITDKSVSYQYQLLDRMKIDCLANNHFWGHENHFEYMKYLYSILPVQPEWLSLADIQRFEKEIIPF